MRGRDSLTWGESGEVEEYDEDNFVMFLFRGCV